MLGAAARNVLNGHKVLKHLLKEWNDSSIPKLVVIAAVSNENLAYDVVEVIEKHTGQPIEIDEEVLTKAAPSSFILFKLLFSHYPAVLVNEALALSIIKQKSNTMPHLNLIFQRNPQRLQSDRVLAMAAFSWQAPEFEYLLRKSGKKATAQMLEVSISNTSCEDTFALLTELLPKTNLSRRMLQICAAFGGLEIMRSILALDRDFEITARELGLVTQNRKCEQTEQEDMQDELIKCSAGALSPMDKRPRKSRKVVLDEFYHSEDWSQSFAAKELEVVHALLEGREPNLDRLCP